MAIQSGVRVDESQPDIYSGQSIIEDNEELTIEFKYQSINFTSLTLDGILTLEGDLWLA
jgi:hypothetical protein